MESFTQTDAPATPRRRPIRVRRRYAGDRDDFPPAALTPRETQRFATEGYLALPAFCTTSELQRIRALLSALFRKKIGHAEGQQFDMLGLDTDARFMKQPQIVNPSVFESALLQTTHFQKVAFVARQLLGPYAQFSFDHSIVKPPRSRAATPWHQDEAHHNHRFFRYRQISFWMPLQDTPAMSGCMRYIPGSHLGPVLPHRCLDDDPRIHAMECPGDEFDASLAVEEPATAGACLLHDGRTLHSALPNQSAKERMAYIIAFVGPPQPREPVRVAKSTAPRRSAAVPANQQRRHRWLLRGGFVTTLARRLRQGLRSPPKIFFLKLRLIARRWWN